MKVYEGNYKSWDLIIISLTGTHLGLVRKCNENAHDAWKYLIDKYEVSDDEARLFKWVNKQV